MFIMFDDDAEPFVKVERLFVLMHLVQNLDLMWISLKLVQHITISLHLTQIILNVSVHHRKKLLSSRICDPKTTKAPDPTILSIEMAVDAIWNNITSTKTIITSLQPKTILPLQWLRIIWNNIISTKTIIISKTILPLQWLRSPSSENGSGQVSFSLFAAMLATFAWVSLTVCLFVCVGGLFVCLGELSCLCLEAENVWPNEKSCWFGEDDSYWLTAAALARENTLTDYNSYWNNSLATISVAWGLVLRPEMAWKPF